MKVKVTKKEIMENYKNVICIGYCDLQWLLNCENEKYYTCGVYGWNSDIYEINNYTCICTGYRPFGNIEVNYNIQKKYDDEARAICCDYSLTYEQQKEKLNDLINKFVSEVTK